jgi:intein/homing endonuclease
VDNFLIQFDTHSVSLICTDNHKIKTDKGWIQAKQLKQGHNLFLHKNLMERPIFYTQTKDIIPKEEKGFMWQFGNITREKFQKATMYIMLTAILTTMILRTLIALGGLCICGTKQKRDLKTTLNGLKNFMQKELKKLKSGMQAKKAGHGINNTALRDGLTDHTSQSNANNAAMNTKQGIQEHQSFAIKTVKRKPLEQEEEVFDLMIEDCHEYYANGVLVHNCLDSVRYVALMKLKLANNGKYFILRS